jgi:cytochrome P450
MFAVPRFAEAREVLRNHRVFSSGKGVSIDEQVNEATAARFPNSLTSDPPLHDEIRRVTSAPVLPGVLRQMKDVLDNEAERLVCDLCSRTRFDGIGDFAQVLPLNIVSQQVGLPDYGRENMLRWAAATFNAIGPMNERGRRALDEIAELHEFCRTEAVPGRLRPGGWAARLYEAADRGDIPIERCPGMMREYIAPSLDTTIFATGHLLRLLGENPQEWEKLKSDPSLTQGAINEALRIESPIRSFSRFLMSDYQFGDVTVPMGSRILVLYGSANRDERRWEDPSKFDITRKATDHLAFGHGIHACMGTHLARMEMTALLEAMLRHVDRIVVGQPTRAWNNLLNGYATLPAEFHRRANGSHANS